MKWNILAAALAMSLLLTACGGDDAGPQANTGPEETTSAAVGDTPTPEGEPAQASQPSAQPESAAPEPSVEPEPEPLSGLMPEGEPVEETWFADAVFLGDSRTDGLQLYSGIKGTTFFSYKGLSVFSIDDKACIDLDGQEVTVLDALSRAQFAKVYILLGINELGYRDTNAFKEAYSTLVTSVRELQPEADIYLQLQPPVNETVAKAKGMNEYINNERITLFNDLITQVAEEQEVALVNVWESLADENGQLPADITSDGVHMKRAGYETWYAYLRTHTGTTPVVEPAPAEDAVETPAPAEGESTTETETETEVVE